jgi:FMN phosphatase YigB (HAD superfamily)
MQKGHFKKILLFVSFVLATLPFSRHFFSLQADEPTNNKDKKVIIFDIGGILITTNIKTALDVLGSKSLAAYSFFDWRSPHNLRPVVYKLIDLLSTEKNTTVCDHFGDCLPFLFCQVLKGEITESQALELVLKTIEKNKDHFCSAREQELCKKVAQMMFDHELLISLQEEVKAGVELLQECIKNGHTVLIFSNYGPQSFAELKKKFPHIFSQIPDTHLIISGHVGHVKPEPSAFEQLEKRLKQLGVITNPDTCFFIDDQKENIAQSSKNITAIHVEKQNFKKAEEIILGSQQSLKKQLKRRKK